MWLRERNHPCWLQTFQYGCFKVTHIPAGQPHPCSVSKAQPTHCFPSRDAGEIVPWFVARTLKGGMVLPCHPHPKEKVLPTGLSTSHQLGHREGWSKVSNATQGQRPKSPNVTFCQRFCLCNTPVTPQAEELTQGPLEHTSDPNYNIDR